MDCNFEFSGNSTTDRQSTNFTDSAQSNFREQALCELQQQSGDGNKTVTDAASPKVTSDQKELEFPNIYNGPITRDIREVPLNPGNPKATDMVLGVPDGDSNFDELNKMTNKMFEDMLNPRSDAKPLTGPGGTLEDIVSDAKPLTGPGGTLEDIVYDGKVIQIPDDVIDCGFGDKGDEIPGAGRLMPNGPDVKAESGSSFGSRSTGDSENGLDKIIRELEAQSQFQKLPYDVLQAEARRRLQNYNSTDHK